MKYHARYFCIFCFILAGCTAPPPAPSPTAAPIATTAPTAAMVTPTLAAPTAKPTLIAALTPTPIASTEPQAMMKTDDGSFETLRASYEQQTRSATTIGELERIDGELAAIESRQSQALIAANARLDATASRQLNIESSSISALRDAARLRMRGGQFDDKAADLSLHASESIQQNQGPEVTQEVVSGNRRRR